MAGDFYLANNKWRELSCNMIIIILIMRVVWLLVKLSCPSEWDCISDGGLMDSHSFSAVISRVFILLVNNKQKDWHWIGCIKVSPTRINKIKAIGLLFNRLWVGGWSKECVLVHVQMLQPPTAPLLAVLLLLLFQSVASKCGHSVQISKQSSMSTKYWGSAGGYYETFRPQCRRKDDGG